MAFIIAEDFLYVAVVMSFTKDTFFMTATILARFFISVAKIAAAWFCFAMSFTTTSFFFTVVVVVTVISTT